MIDGMPASSSMAVPTGPRSHFGAISVRNKAMPKLTGTAISMAMSGGHQRAVDRHQRAEVLPTGSQSRDW